ncbi:hypothetical protein Tco_0538938, partial [Tanacetum coccineum]
IGNGRLDQAAGCPTCSVGFGLPAELTAGLFLLAAGSNPSVGTDADEFLLPAGTDAALDLQGT